jgi:hypothetical protein
MHIVLSLLSNKERHVLATYVRTFLGTARIHSKTTRSTELITQDVSSQRSVLQAARLSIQPTSK